ncbi:MAG: hypothetical protein HYV63_07260 [Candidatus Schekmanbacteria bacterium]|nr:hypothetical protein [Candidatus Schekmanbacteria bacterium]
MTPLPAAPARAAGDSFESGTFAALPWERNPADAWQVVAGDAADGDFAARSAPLADGDAAVLAVTLALSTPGEVAFWVKTSTEAGADALAFAVGGASGTFYEKDRWSGEQPWTRVACALASGTWTFRWTYRKDGAGAAGQDAVWIDAVSFPDFTVPPSPTPTPSPSPTATPSPSVTATAALTPTPSGTRTATPTATPTPTPEPPDEDFEAGGLAASAYPFRVAAGEAAWVTSRDAAYLGSFALRPLPLATGQRTAVELTLDITENGVIRFWTKTELADEDVFTFSIDGQWRGDIAGASDWEEQHLTVARGLRTFRWELAKSSAGFTGKDTVWIDAIRFPPHEIAAVPTPTGLASGGTPLLWVMAITPSTAATVAVHLAWTRSDAPDFAYYALYRATEAFSVPALGLGAGAGGVVLLGVALAWHRRRRVPGRGRGGGWRTAAGLALIAGSGAAALGLWWHRVAAIPLPEGEPIFVSADRAVTSYVDHGLSIYERRYHYVLFVVRDGGASSSSADAWVNPGTGTSGGIRLLYPRDGIVVGDPRLPVVGEVGFRVDTVGLLIEAPQTRTLLFPERRASPDAEGVFAALVTLAPGANDVVAVADAEGGALAARVRVTYDAAAPVVAITDPPMWSVAQGATVIVRGTTTDPAGRVAVNGIAAVVEIDGTFAAEVPIRTDRAGAVNAIRAVGVGAAGVPGPEAAAGVLTGAAAVSSGARTGAGRAPLDAYADAVRFCGALDPGRNKNTDCTAALGNNFSTVSLGGPGGYAIFDMGFLGEIVDLPGPDLYVQEAGANTAKREPFTIFAIGTSGDAALAETTGSGTLDFRGNLFQAALVAVVDRSPEICDQDESCEPDDTGNLPPDCCTSGLVQSETPGSDIQWLRALSYGLAVELDVPKVLPVGVAVPLRFAATVEGTGAGDEAAPAGGEAAGRTREVALPGTYTWEAAGPELELAAGETADPANEITALQAGEVTLTVAYIPPGGEEMTLEAEPVAIGVASVGWEGYDPGDGHTGYEAADASGACGAAARIFAERRQPPGRAWDDLHDKVTIRTQLTSAPPAGETLTVYFRVLDPIARTAGSTPMARRRTTTSPRAGTTWPRGRRS